MKKNVLCPQCGRKVATYDGKSTINIIVNCRRCKKRIVYDVLSGVIEIKKMLPRTTSSGCTIY